MQKESKLYLGNCLEIMPQFETDSVDAIVTDPPYGISFMGKDWDKAVPSIAIWRECLRVLKPGAFAFVMCIPRQDCLARMICRLEDAGFNVAFSSIYWTYASGFPKAQNLSKKIDHRAGVKQNVVGIDKIAAAKSNKTKFNQFTAITPGKIGVNTQEFSSHRGEITEAVTEQAKALEGAYPGFQPKPAVEVVIVAIKPLEEKTYVDQAIANKHGCTWLGDCRIPYENDKDTRHTKLTTPGIAQNSFCVGKKFYEDELIGSNKGRFPANVLCEDNVLNDSIERKSGAVLTHHKRSGNSNLGKTFKIRNRTGEFADWKSNSGEYSRYFSLDAWFAERIKQLPKEARKTFPWLIVPKASKSEKNSRLEQIEQKEVQPAGFVGAINNGSEPPRQKRANSHTTVKPIKLMSWLITLASREGDIVLDPFCGSGTTLIAAKMLGRQYIGIELEKEYYDIARLRIDEVQKNINRYL